MITRADLPPEREAAIRKTLEESLQAGHSILKTNGTSLDAVQAAIRVLEDSPLFNAGRGAALTSEGKAELDASIMDGATLKAGAVGSVKGVKNPIDLARLVMDETWHVMLVGEGAAQFARQHNLPMMPEEYFITERRLELLRKAQEEERRKASGKQRSDFNSNSETRMGTVGAVALDRHGNLAAGTSTGGLTNKRFGRVGDSPIIGAGNYANNATCAVSGTGQGEYFMRGLVAYDISALMEYQGLKVSEAAEKVVMQKLKQLGGTGGVIALDRQGNFALPFNTEGMYRGHISGDGKPWVGIYPTDK